MPVRNVVEIVRDAARQRAERIHFLGVAQLGFQHPVLLRGLRLLGDVLAESVNPRGPARRILFERQPHRHRSKRTIGATKTALILALVAVIGSRQGLFQLVLHLARVLRQEKPARIFVRAQPLAALALRGGAKQLEKTVIEGEVLGFRIEFPVAEPGRVHRQRELRLVTRQRVFTFLALGHIDDLRNQMPGRPSGLKTIEAWTCTHTTWPFL